ncbi:glutamate racemase [Liquorilactobacillus sicerae]|uniref:glutamate racemase n=1 Tax=Liquorilactobacillus sicerae TaxID=1416943 RepID=UPI0024817A37|nr:glutamate racemase [Liquorilactobacillus sicerae]
MDTVNNRPVGVFDSGVGGISVLRELYRLLPQENYIFYGDSANAPYGTRPTAEVRQLSLAVTEKLLSRQIKALVIACNTATSAAIQRIRQQYPKLPVVGLEPAVKPAVEQFSKTSIAVMATELTLREVKLQKLLERYQDQAKLIKVPAPALVEYVEKGELNTPEVRTYLTGLLAPLGKLSSIVLGCTHFPFIKPALKQVVGTEPKIIDGGPGAARELQRVLAKANLLNSSAVQGKVTFYNSNPDPAEITLSQRLFQTPLD